MAHTPFLIVIHASYGYSLTSTPLPGRGEERGARERMPAPQVVPRAAARGHCSSMIASRGLPLRSSSLALETSSAAGFFQFSFLGMTARWWNGFDSLVHLPEVKKKTNPNLWAG